MRSSMVARSILVLKMTTTTRLARGSRERAKEKWRKEEGRRKRKNGKGKREKNVAQGTGEIVQVVSQILEKCGRRDSLGDVVTMASDIPCDVV
jgi:hypothetical protein